MSPRTPIETEGHGLVRAAAACAVRTLRLLIVRRLHLRRDRLGNQFRLPDGRHYEVFRESTCDGSPSVHPVTLAVWFHLRGVPAGARARRFLFERGSIFNTLLFAGFDGYRVKLWMVDPVTSDYAGLYSFASEDTARTYGRYITAVLRPLSVPRSVGFEILPDLALEDYLAS
jgi:hypothetical protein